MSNVNKLFSVYVILILIVLLMQFIIPILVSETTSENKVDNQDFFLQKSLLKKTDHALFEVLHSHNVLFDADNDSVIVGIGMDSEPIYFQLNGKGTRENPFILENETILRLYVPANAKHYLIQNCTFNTVDTQTTTLEISPFFAKTNDSNEGGVTILNNTFKGGKMAIYARDFVERKGVVTILNKTFKGEKIAIYAQSFKGEQLTYSSNFFNTSYIDFFIHESKNVIFDTNHIEQIELVESKINPYCVHSLNSSQVSFIDNLFFNLGQSGIGIVETEDLVFNSNKLYNTRLNLLHSVIYFDYNTNLGTYVVENNTANGVLMKVLVEKKGLTISGVYGQVLLLNCEDIIISNVTIVGGIAGIDVFNSSRIQILNSHFENIEGNALELNGIDIFVSNNTFIGNLHAINTFSAFHHILLAQCLRLTVSYNSFYNMTSYVLNASRGRITGTISHNNFIENNPTDLYQTMSKQDIKYFDDRDVIGNYWSDYAGDGKIYTVYRYEHDPGSYYTYYDNFPSSTPFAPFFGEFVPPWEQETEKTVFSFLPFLVLLFSTFVIRRKSSSLS